MKAERLATNKTPERAPSDYPFVAKVAPLLQVHFIRHMFKEQYGQDIKEVSSEQRNHYTGAWLKENAAITRGYFDTHASETVDINDPEAVMDLFERIPLQAVDTIH